MIPGEILPATARHAGDLSPLARRGPPDDIILHCIHLGAATVRALCQSPSSDSHGQHVPGWTNRPDDALATACACRVTRACSGCWACGTVAVRELRVSRYVLSCHEALAESLRDSRHVRRRVRYNDSCRLEVGTGNLGARTLS